MKTQVYKMLRQQNHDLMKWRADEVMSWQNVQAYETPSRWNGKRWNDELIKYSTWCNDNLMKHQVNWNIKLHEMTNWLNDKLI